MRHNGWADRGTGAVLQPGSHSAGPLRSHCNAEVVTDFKRRGDSSGQGGVVPRGTAANGLLGPRRTTRGAVGGAQLPQGPPSRVLLLQAAGDEGWGFDASEALHDSLREGGCQTKGGTDVLPYSGLQMLTPHVGKQCAEHMVTQLLRQGSVQPLDQSALGKGEEWPGGLRAQWGTGTGRWWCRGCGLAGLWGPSLLGTRQGVQHRAP